MDSTLTMMKENIEQYKQKYIQSYTEVHKDEELETDLFYDTRMEVNEKLAEKEQEYLGNAHLVQLNDQEFATMTNQEMPTPDFEVLSKKQENALSKKEKAAYKEQVNQFQKQLNDWAKHESARQDTIRELATLDRIVAEKNEDIPPDPDIMMEKLNKITSESRVDNESFNKIQAKAWAKIADTTPGEELTVTATRAYLGGEFKNMNKCLRTGETIFDADYGFKDDLSEDAALAEITQSALQKRTLGRDMVLRRGCYSDALAPLMGENLSVEEAKAMITQKLGSGEDVVFHEKGFCSTSCYNDGGFPGDMEFIILAHKDADGMAIAGTDLAVFHRENEVLLNAGQKFKVLKMEDTELGQTRIFMEVISKTATQDQPTGEEGGS